MRRCGGGTRGWAGGGVAAAVAASVARSENARRAQQVSSAASEASRIRREADRPKDVTNAAVLSLSSILKRPRVLTLRQKNLLTIAPLWPEFLHIVQLS